MWASEDLFQQKLAQKITNAGFMLETQMHAELCISLRKTESQLKDLRERRGDVFAMLRSRGYKGFLEAACDAVLYTPGTIVALPVLRAMLCHTVRPVLSIVSVRCHYMMHSAVLI